MSGRFRLLDEEAELPKFTHAIFFLDNDKRLVFSDQRHFGFMKLVRARELEETKELKKLAPEPFSEEFSTTYLANSLSRTRRSIKETILDQTIVSGLGNIYAAEALFISRIKPSLPAADLSKRRVVRLRQTVINVLAESISNGSTLNVDPENIDGSYYGGAYEWKWRVYDREGEPCDECATRIRRISQGGRSTFFCPRCQRR
jgi:formamidopyrimidine-DNA glycosylase